MKMGIVTFHRALNYGAVLQSYALCNFLNSKGYSTEIIDYRNPAIETIYHSNQVNLSDLNQYEQFGLKAKLKRLVEIVYYKKLRKKFSKFLDVMSSKPVFNDTWQEIFNKYDYFITGSDQVFNCTLTNDDFNYYLKGIPSKKRIAYSASLGGYSLEENKQCIEELMHFHKISVREELLIERLQRVGINHVACHMDPVFLLEKKEWEEILELPKIKEKYVLIFSMNRSNDLVEYARKCIGNKKLKLIFLSPALVRTIQKGIKQIWYASPQQYLGWIYNAEYVFTDSFHGCAFSILFEKNFYVEVNPKLGSSDRISNLLKIFCKEDYSKPEKIGLIENHTTEMDIIRKNQSDTENYFKNI